MRVKNPKKYLQAAKKLEARHISRKTPEIGEIYAFDRQFEHFRQQQLDSLLTDAEEARQAGQSALEPFHEAEADRVADLNAAASAVHTFEAEAGHSRQYAAGNAFDAIAEMQGFDLVETRPHAVKQLPAASSSDLFEQDATDLTEQHLNDELTRNSRAITPWKDKVRTALIHQDEPASPPSTTEQETHARTPETPSLSDDDIETALQHEEELSKTPSANSVLYFRPAATPPKHS